MEEHFKKFVEDLEKRENAQREKKRQQEKDENNWQVRELNKRYREKPGNRTSWSR